MNIETINGEWFYDDVTPRGVSFDGLLPQACKIPLGNMQDFELIHTPEKMAEFQSNDWYQKNWSLADTLMTFSPLRPETSVLVEAYRKEMDEILSFPCDLGCCRHKHISSDTWPTRGSCRGLRILQEDLSRYGDMMTGNNDLDEGKFYDVKKEIYRLPDRVIAALAKFCEIKSTGIFSILDELYDKEIISFEGRDNLASTSAIAIRLRLSTYLEAGKQGELLSSNSNDKTGEKALVYHMPTDEELFHFFFVAIPLYDELQQFKTSGNIPSSLRNLTFFNKSDSTMGHIYCRLLRYDKAIECYERAVRENPDNLSAEISRMRVSLFVNHYPEKSDDIRENLDNLLRKIIKNFSQVDTIVLDTALEFSPLLNHLDIEECRQLIEGLHFADEIYGSWKYSAIAYNILFDTVFTSDSDMSKPQELLLLTFLNNLSLIISQEDEIDGMIFKSTSFIEEEGVSTKGIVLLNSLGEFLYRKGKLDKAYRCFQRALSMEHQLYGTRPNVNMMTSLKFLCIIAKKLLMYAESKFYCKSLVQLFESFDGINTKLRIKETYMELSCVSYNADETLRKIENGLKITTGTKNEKELYLNCVLYCQLAMILHFEKSPKQAWRAVLDAQACLRNSTSIATRQKMICVVTQTLIKIEKSKEGIELLENELQKFTLASQAQERVFYLKALGKLCLVENLAPEAKKYYSQAIYIQEKNNQHVFSVLESRIGILKAVVMEENVSNEKAVLDKALSSAMKLPASIEKYSFLKKIGKVCQSIGDIDNARLCCLEAFRSATELPASDKKCSFLKKTGELFKSISEIALARQCYNEALKTYKKESSITKKLPFVECDLEMNLGFLAEETFSIDSTQQTRYDRAADILRQHVATGYVDSLTVKMFRALALEYRSIDGTKAVLFLLESLKVSKIVYGEDSSNKMIASLLRELSDSCLMTGDIQASIKYRERQIKMDLELNSSNPFNEYIMETLINWALTSFKIPSDKDSIECVQEIFSSSLNNKAFLLNTTAARTTAAKCLTFIAVLFYTSSDFEKAESLNEKASQLFGEVEESVETDPCRETCDLLKTMLSSEQILPSQRKELYSSIFNIGGSYSYLLLTREERLMMKKRLAGNEEHNFRQVKEQARSTLVEEQNTLSAPTIVKSHSELLEYHKNKGDFQRAAEVHASLQPQLLNFYEKISFDGEEKLICNAIESKDENRPCDAIRFLDFALQLPETHQTTKILKLRGECFLSMGHFRSAAIDFTFADALYSTKTIDNREELCEYSEVLIGLIKSEILCNNVEAAWLVCERGIKLLLDHELKETINRQAIKLCNLGVKCINSFLERGKEKENMLVQAHYLCQHASRLYVLILLETIDGSEIKDVLTTILEAEFLLKNISPTLRQKDEGENLLKEINTSTKNISDLLDSSLLAYVENDVESVTNPFLLLARFQIIVGDIEQSTNSLNESLIELFSTALPDYVSFFEEFLPLLQAINATKVNAPDQSRSPFQQAVDMCIRASANQNKSLNYVNQFLITSIIIYRSLGQAQEAMVIAEIGLEMTDLMCDISDRDKLNHRCSMLLHLAEIHQQNSSNPSFDADEELNRAQHYYLIDRGREEDMVLCKDLSYANFLCERKRFEEAVAVLKNMRNLGELLWNKYVYVEYSSYGFFGAGVEKSVKTDGELFTTVGNVLYNLMVRAYVGMRKKKEAVAMCEILTDANSQDVHESKFGKRPSCKPHLVEDCHRELLSLLSEEDRHQFQICNFPLSSSILAKLYYMLGEYEMAAKYFPKDVETSEMLEMKIFCLRLAGNQLVDSNRGNESLPLFQDFLEMLQVKEGFLDKPLHDQFEILQTYSFANQYYLFRSLGETHAERENIDAAIQCYERCIELDEDFMCGQHIVALLSELYQIKALTVDLDSRTVYMDLAWEAFQKLFRKTEELTAFVELKFASLLTRLDCHVEAFEHFWKVVLEGADDTLSITFGNVEKPLVDVYLRREIEARGGKISMPIMVLLRYQIISTYTKLGGIIGEEIAQEFLHVLEKYVEDSEDSLVRSMAGYAYMIAGNKERAAEIFVSVLEMNPGHPPVIEALESCGM